LNIVHFKDTNVNIVQINPEATPMQTVISEIAFTFVDDAIALMVGARDVVISTAAAAWRAARRRVMAPVDRLAQACDVAGVIAARRPAAMRRGLAPRRRERSGPFGLLDAFRNLRDLS
jgi:hypothetical protein